MDAKKALFRAKLREAGQNREKRIDSPLVRYNEYEQPICKVCNVTLKSESLWPAHQVSRKHHEAIENMKALAAGRDHTIAKSGGSNDLPKSRPSASLPPDFFDTPVAKKQKAVQVEFSNQDKRQEVNSEQHSKVDLVETKKSLEPTASNEVGQPSRKVDSSQNKQLKGTIPEGFFDKKDASEVKQSDQMSQASISKRRDESQQNLAKGSLPKGFFDSGVRDENKVPKQFSQPNKGMDDSDSEVRQAKGVLPEGFFDNKDADLRARGIQPVKIDVNDAYKEFEKEIQDNLQEVDDRLEEEEIDAAEVREEFELVEQLQYRDRVEMVKKKLMEAKTARLARGDKRPAFMGQESSDESSSDSGDEENFAVDWRAQHL